MLVTQSLWLNAPPRLAFDVGVDCEAWPGLGIPCLREARIARPEDREGRRAIAWVWRACGITLRFVEEQHLDRAHLRVSTVAHELPCLRGYAVHVTYGRDGAGTLMQLRAEFEIMGGGLFVESVMAPVAEKSVADTLHAIKRHAEARALWAAPPSGAAMATGTGGRGY